ncbi:MAG TPA: efflux RND transporter periplasmic adaptor subunit [Pyrinomonadaceae bacterium]|jgi:cobalt-zinc-cadmium efflux system membrane fusion protein|nr:efflux RND transporter periplasmic adaptor subunit [Pyrinomonadaceae bacterium]
MRTLNPNDHTDQTLNSVNNGGPRRRQIVIVAVIAVFALLVVFAGILWLRPAKEVKTEAPAAAPTTGKVAFLMEQQWLIHMKLAQAEEQTVARQITATGRVIPAANSQAMVAPPVGGIVSNRNLPRVGQHVARGQTIAIIQQVATSAEQAQVRAAAASLSLENARLEADRRTASGEVEAARVRVDLATKEAARAQRLYERKAFSERQMQAAEADLRAAKAQFDAAVKRLEALENPGAAERTRAGVGSANASYTIRAPLSGYVTKVNKSIGEQVAAGEAIVEISNLDTVWIEAPIFEKDLSRLAGNVSATFTTPAYPDQEFKGTVVDIGAVIDEQTRATKVIFQLPNDGRALRLGMQANVRLDAGEQVTAMMIPKEAVLEHEGKKIVYVLLSGEEFERREVTIGDELSGKVAVLSGLNKGERVVTQGAYQLKLQELQPAEAGAHTHET